MADAVLDVWLYGELARHAKEADQGSFANLQIHAPEGTTIGQILAQLGIPTEERGITFVNGQLSAMPGLQPDLDHPLKDGDRVAFFHTRSMWPFQYRHGVAMTGEMGRAMADRDDGGVQSTYRH